jgi:hypothetical protein
MAEIRLRPKPFQRDFYLSTKRFACMKAGIGTGKTMWGILKVVKFCEQYPNSLALIVRMEFTDLRDSTMNDFETYTGWKVNSNKEFEFSNGSKIMFRHGSELNVLKNINLSIALMEQGEEFEDETTFDFIRDRLRRNNAPYRQLCVIANANGHNWIWDRWFSNPPSIEYDGYKATTFDNESNLPADFIADLRTMELQSPNHYRRMVMNDDDVQDSTDQLINEVMLDRLKALTEFNYFNVKICSIDPSMGGDECVINIFDNTAVIEQKILHERDTMKIVGEANVLMGRHKINTVGVDTIGIGQGVGDALKQSGKDVVYIVSSETAYQADKFSNRRTEMWWYGMEQIRDGLCAFPTDAETRKQLCSTRYKILNGKVALEPKDMVKKRLGRSPDRADAWIYGIWTYREQVKMDRRSVEAKKRNWRYETNRHISDDHMGDYL